MWPSRVKVRVNHDHVCLIAGQLCRLSEAGLMMCHQQSHISLSTTQGCSQTWQKLTFGDNKSFRKGLICSNGDIAPKCSVLNVTHCSTLIMLSAEAVSTIQFVIKESH